MSQNAPKVCVVVLNFNGMDVNEACLSSLQRSDYANLTILVVDNASTDESAAWIEQNCPRVKLLRNKKNGGWAGGNNEGIRVALAEGADFVWLLNNDVEVEPRCIRALVDYAGKNPDAGILSPVIHFMDPRDRIWFQGGMVDRAACEVTHCDTLSLFERLPQDERCASGCAMFVRSSVFKQVGPIDEQFFMYYEDTDFSIRAARAGFGIEVVEGSKLYHKVGASIGGVEGATPLKVYHIFRSGLIFWRKHLGWWQFHRRYCDGHLAKWMNALDVEWSDAVRRDRAQAVIDALWYFVSGKRNALERPASPGWFTRWVVRRPWLVARLMAFRLG